MRGREAVLIKQELVGRNIVPGCKWDVVTVGDDFGIKITAQDQDYTFTESSDLMDFLGELQQAVAEEKAQGV